MTASEDANRRSESAQLLAECWRSALEFGPSSADDTLANHGVTHKGRAKLVQAICAAFACPLDAGLFPVTMQFQKTAELLGPLVESRKNSEPVIWLAPGLGGVGLGELLLAGAYCGPGRVHLLRYPLIEQMAEGGAIEAHVAAVLGQLPAPADGDGLMLAGYSLGAHVMLEVAFRLSRRGTPVAGLVLMNSVGFPQRSDLAGFDYRLSECRRLYEFRRWMEWQLAAESRAGLRILRRGFAILTAIGLTDASLHLNYALSCAVRLKAFSYRIQHAKYPGAITLLRPGGTGSHSEPDAGWEHFCESLDVRYIDATPRDFLSKEHRVKVAEELAAFTGRHRRGCPRPRS